MRRVLWLLAVMVPVSSSCGGDDGVKAGGPCQRTADCASGLLCVDGVCGGNVGDADSDTDADTDSDSETDTESNTTTGIGCEDFGIDVQEGPPADLVLIVDRSGSMSLSMPDGTPKWDAMVAAVDDVTHALQDRIHFGLASFPAPGDEDLCAAGSVTLAPETANADAIVAALTAAGYGGGTPTADTVAAVGTWLGTPRDGHDGHPPAILLATDGGPGCNRALDRATCQCMGAVDAGGACAAVENCLDDAATYGAIDAVFSSDPAIPVWVVGLPGTESYTDVLSEMARRGGTARAVDPVYYDARSADELSTALEDIASSLVTCTFTLKAAPEDPDGLRVFVDGEEVPRSIGGSDGWAYVGADYQTIELIGSWCDGLSDGDSHQVTAYYDCDAIY